MVAHAFLLLFGEFRTSEKIAFRRAENLGFWATSASSAIAKSLWHPREAVDCMPVIKLAVGLIAN